MALKTKNAVVSDDYFDLIKRFPLVNIRTGKQLKEAHAMIDELTRIPENDLTIGQAEYLEVLGDLTLKFEMPLMTGELEKVGALDLLKHLLLEHEMTGSDLGRLLGQRELGSKVLRRDRAISKSHAKVLGSYFGLPAETFLR